MTSVYHAEPLHNSYVPLRQILPKARRVKQRVDSVCRVALRTSWLLLPIGKQKESQIIAKDDLCQQCVKTDHQNIDLFENIAGNECVPVECTKPGVPFIANSMLQTNVYE